MEKYGLGMAKPRLERSELTLTCEDKKQEEDTTDLTKNGESCAQRLDDICRS